MRLDNKIFIVQHSEPVDDMSTKIGIDIFWKVLSSALPVPGPVGKVTDDLEISYNHK